MNQLPATALPPDFARSISHDEMGALPIRRYEGTIHVVTGPQDLPDVLHDILQEHVIGFDTETRPAFKPGESYLPSIAQFATARAVYILPVQQRDLFAAMQAILASPDVIKVGVSVGDDLRNLKKLFEFDEQSVLDLGKVAKSHGMKQTGVRNLAGMFLGARIPKGAKTTNWAARVLTAQQLTYAATDAWACRELYLRFRDLQMVG